MIAIAKPDVPVCCCDYPEPVKIEISSDASKDKSCDCCEWPSTFTWSIVEDDPSHCSG